MRLKYANTLALNVNIYYICGMIKTYQYRIKDASRAKALEAHARAVNVTWNYCNDAQKHALKWRKKWPSGFDLSNLTSGSSKELGIHSQTVQAVCERYHESRKAKKKASLRYRGHKNLGWIPFKALSIKHHGEYFTYQKKQYKVWYSRPIPVEAKIKSGSFSQDSQGRWYINICIELPDAIGKTAKKEVGIDLGLKDLATFSSGEKIEAKQFYRDLEESLGEAQRANKTKRVKAIHAKIKNRRKDYLQKLSTKIVKEYGLIVVGDVSSLKLAKTRMAKSVLDAGWSSFRDMLKYKAIAHSAVYIEVNERNTTRTCSHCGVIPDSSPKGMGMLGIREWVCSSCGVTHDRDVNAAKLILERGHALLAVGIPVL